LTVTFGFGFVVDFGIGFGFRFGLEAFGRYGINIFGLTGALLVFGKGGFDGIGFEGRGFGLVVALEPGFPFCTVIMTLFSSVVTPIQVPPLHCFPSAEGINVINKAIWR
jgi:hypothetical protein